MKKALITTLLLVTVLVAVLGLSSCTSWDSPYVKYDKEGSTVSVEFLPDLPGADAPAQAIAEILGVECEDVIEQVAVVHCYGDCNHTSNKIYRRCGRKRQNQDL